MYKTQTLKHDGTESANCGSPPTSPLKKESLLNYAASNMAILSVKENRPVSTPKITVKKKDTRQTIGTSDDLPEPSVKRRVQTANKKKRVTSTVYLNRIS